MYTLVGERIGVRLLNIEDAKQLYDYKIKNRAFLRPFQPTQSDNSFVYSSVKQSILESMVKSDNDKLYQFGIFLTENKELIGTITLSNIIRGSFENAYIGYSLDENEQSKGYMTEAVKLILQLVKEKISLHRIQAATLTENISSIKVLEKCGFKKVGLSKGYLKIDGKWQDHYLYEYIFN
jgi:ribosomal-protein-alanine N-acetyltransferase